MLGHTVRHGLEDAFGKGSVFSSSRSPADLSDKNHVYFAAEAPDFRPFEANSFDYVINCIGIIKPFIHSHEAESVKRAIAVNSLFPIQLAKWAEGSGSRVIQIATDCVYSGRDGEYLEQSPHDAEDIYGKTKSLGEVESLNVMHLRASIIGREINHDASLVSWLKNQPVGSSITGYTDHQWNGITTSAFAKICLGVIRQGTFKAGLQHLVPGSDVTKDELVRLIADRLGRHDVEIKSGISDKQVDRRIRSEFPGANQKLWLDAGYSSVPTVEELVSTL